MKKEPKQKLVHSPSSLKKFEQCPYKYYRTMVVKDIKEPYSGTADRGTSVHKQLEDRLQRGVVLPDTLNHMEPICAALESIDNVVIQCEKELALNAGYNRTTFFANDVYIRMKVDAVLISNDSALVVDWKTGEKGRQYQDSLQLDMNATALLCMDDTINSVDASYCWVDLPGTPVDPYGYNRKRLGDMIEAIEQRISRVDMALKHDEWPWVPNKLCEWCAVKNACEGYYRHTKWGG